ncbi:MAG: TerB N-terminal domain-containing protein [Azospirillaceae bacterium]|nr:TerB N-terminal domain-containing protein [Azospirillaceae bacterium]
MLPLIQRYGVLLASMIAIVSGIGLNNEAGAAPPTMVRQAQQALVQQGYDPGPVDGHAGARTHTAIQAFQGTHNLPMTGELDAETVRLLVGQSPQPPRPPEPRKHKEVKTSLAAPATSPIKDAKAGTAQLPPPPVTVNASGPPTSAPTPIAILGGFVLVLGGVGWWLHRTKPSPLSAVPIPKALQEQAPLATSYLRTGRPESEADDRSAPSPYSSQAYCRNLVVNFGAGAPPHPSQGPAQPTEMPQVSSPTEPLLAGSPFPDTGDGESNSCEPPLSPGEINRRKVAEILARKALLQSAPTSAPATEVPHPIVPLAPLPALPTPLDPDIAEPDPPEAPLSPGEINRRKVAEILAGRPSQAQVKSAQSPASPTHQQHGDIDWGNLGIAGGAAKSEPIIEQAPTKKNGGWVPAGKAVTVASITVSDGMIYVGTRLPCLRGHGTENCLINPNWSVRVATSAASPNYFPAYERLDPGQRYVYLRWLAEGRRDPNIDIGYVFLFFYGLERRLIGDGSTEDAHALINEVERLRGIYGHNPSFSRYAAELLGVARLTLQGQTNAPPELTDRNWEMPLALKVGLGGRVAAGEPLSGEWMLAWLHCDPELVWRTPASRAADTFKILFLKRFSQSFPNGLTVKPPKRMLQPSYRACSGTFSVTITVQVNDKPLVLPDVSVLTAPLTKVRPIAEACMTDLDSYSRFLGKTPERRDGVEAYALLPLDLRDAPPPAVRDLITWLEHTVVGSAVVVPVDELTQRIVGSTIEKPAKRDMQVLSSTLKSFGFGMEPDPDYGGRTLRTEEPVALFRLGDTPPVAPSPAYSGVLLRLTLAVLIAHADGAVAEEERMLLSSHIGDTPDLSDAEQLRLIAHLSWLIACPPELTSLKGRIKTLSAPEREAVGQLAIAVASADGLIEPREIKLLQKLFKALEMDPEAVFSHLNALGTSARTYPASTASTGRPDVVQLDPDRIRRIQADTARVSNVLGAIFADEVTVPEVPSQAEVTDKADEGDDLFVGLAPPHRELLIELLASQTWARADYETLARSLDLMPDGVLETINEWAFDQFDEPILEDGDPLIVNSTLLQFTPHSELEPALNA